MEQNSQSTVALIDRFGLSRNKPYKPQFKFPFLKVIAFIFLLAFCIIWLFPFIVMFTGSLRSGADTRAYPEMLFYPHSGYTLEAYKILLLGIYPEGVQHNATQSFDLAYWFMNSCFSAIGGTALYLFVASLAAYAFTFVDFKYRDLIFMIFVMSMVVPGTATLVGNHSMVYAMGLNKSILALIIPGLGGIYGMYLIRTFFTSIPKDLIESAKMDGYSNFKIYLKIVLPLGKTVIFVQGLFGFMGGWNDLIWPQMLYGAKDTKLWTLQVGMSYLVNNSRSVDLIGTALAGGVVCLLPVLIMYCIAQNKIIEGMAGAGIKR